MLKSKELRVKAWESLKGKYWMAFAVILVTGLIGSLGNSFVSFAQNLGEVLGLVNPDELDSTMAIGALVLNGVVMFSAIIGASIIAVASGIMFYIDSSSGGTDIIALIVRKYSKLDIGKALLVTDVLIVIVGGILSGLTIAVCSFIGLLIKTLGIDLIISLIKKGAKNVK